MATDLPTAVNAATEIAPIRHEYHPDGIADN
jgi:hypothetical protein